MPYGEKKKTLAAPELEHDAIWTEVKVSSFFSSLSSLKRFRVFFFFWRWGGEGGQAVREAPLYAETSHTL